MTASGPIDGSLISASSLTLGALALIFNFWMPEMRAALMLPRKSKLVDRANEIKRLRRALWGRSTPLLVLAVVVALVLAPPALEVMWDAGKEIIHHPRGAWRHYQAVQALFVVVWVLVLVFVGISAASRRSLRAELNRFLKPDS